MKNATEISTIRVQSNNAIRPCTLLDSCTLTNNAKANILAHKLIGRNCDLFKNLGLIGVFSDFHPIKGRRIIVFEKKYGGRNNGGIEKPKTVRMRLLRRHRCKECHVEDM